MKQRFNSQVVLITGASTGIGAALARAFHRNGARLALCSRNHGKLSTLAGELAGARALPCDVTSPEPILAVVRQVLDEFGRLDILVNNAGRGLIAPVSQITAAEARQVMDVNFFGAVHCTHAVLPVMKRQGRGHIVNIAALAGMRALPNSAIYSASKAAIIAFADALRLELHGTGIRLTTVCPGLVEDTEFFHTAARPGTGRYQAPTRLSARQLADEILVAVEREQPLLITPGYARWLVAFNKLAPRWVDKYLLRHMPRS